MTSLAALRIQRHAQWLRNLSLSLRQLVLSSAERPEQIYLFGSRARGDWEGLSDTDLLVVAASKRWTDQLLDHGLADDVIGLDREAWAHLPESDSVIWRNISKVAIPLLELGLEPPYTHVLNDLVQRLQQTGLETQDLEALPLRSLSRMAIQSRYPMDATPPSELFDPDETDQALTTAREVLTILKALDQQG